MAGKKSNTPAEHLADIDEALKRGKTWALKFIELARDNSKDYNLQGWIDDAERAFKDEPDELWDFYRTIQQACTGKTPAGRSAYGEGPLSAEEKTIVGMYRGIRSRWEKNALFLLMQSLAWGGLKPKTTDHLSWKKLRKSVGLPSSA